MAPTPDSKTRVLRHTLATLAYRGAKTLRGAPAEFAALRAAPSTRTPAEILAHMGDLLDWALSMVEGRQAWRDSAPPPWDEEVTRFFRALEALDKRLASAPSEAPEERLFQGPVADALTHVGQLAMLRRMAGAPMRGENYFVAKIRVGTVGLQQAPPRKESE
jgi:hypothetical protein